MTEQTQATAPRKVSLAEKIERLTNDIAVKQGQLRDLVRQQEAEAAFASVGTGDVVEFKVGRADTRRTLRGSVLARAEVEGVDVVQVIAGEGLDTAVYRVKVAELTAVNPVPEETDAAAAAVDEDQAAVDALLNDPVSAEVEAALNAVQL